MPHPLEAGRELLHRAARRRHAEELVVLSSVVAVTASHLPSGENDRLELVPGGVRELLRFPSREIEREDLLHTAGPVLVVDDPAVRRRIERPGPLRRPIR